MEDEAVLMKVQSVLECGIMPHGALLCSCGDKVTGEHKRAEP